MQVDVGVEAWLRADRQTKLGFVKDGIDIERVCAIRMLCDFFCELKQLGVDPCLGLDDVRLKWSKRDDWYGGEKALEGVVRNGLEEIDGLLRLCCRSARTFS